MQRSLRSDLDAVPEHSGRVGRLLDRNGAADLFDPKPELDRRHGEKFDVAGEVLRKIIKV